MRTIPPDEELAISVVDSIRTGDVEALRRLLNQNPGLASARIGNEETSRPLLGVATDWPGHFPNCKAIVATLVEAGADVNAPFIGEHSEAPLHGAASSDDVEMIDALLDAGADIEAPGGVIAGGTPLDDAVAFGQWSAAKRLVERGARTALWHSAALGLMDRVTEYFKGDAPPARYPWGRTPTSEPPDDVTVAFWCACHGGQRETAAYLLERGAELNWISVWDGLTPLDAARREGRDGVVDWLRDRGARSAGELGETGRDDRQSDA